jgi:hypothetical protein
MGTSEFVKSNTPIPDLLGTPCFCFLTTGALAVLGGGSIIKHTLLVCEHNFHKKNETLITEGFSR